MRSILLPIRERRARGEGPGDGVGTILSERADRLRSVDDFEGVHGRRQGCEHLRLRHGNGNVAVLCDGVATGQKLLRIHIGDGARAGDVEVAGG